MTDSKPKCSACKFWRDKAWDDNGGVGKCDNPLVIKQVTIMSETMISKLVKGSTDKHIKYNTKALATSIRFSGDFGCIHFKEV